METYIHQKHVTILSLEATSRSITQGDQVMMWQFCTVEFNLGDTSCLHYNRIFSNKTCYKSLWCSMFHQIQAVASSTPCNDL